VSVLVAVLYYVRAMLIPVGLSFELRIAVTPVAGAMGAVVGLGLPVLAWMCRDRARPFALSVGWLLVALLPVTLLQLVFPLRILVANRFAYPALVAAALLLVWLASRGPRFVALAIVVVVAFVPLTAVRAAVWREPETLWGDVLSDDPGNAVALLGLGHGRYLAKDWPAAAEYLRRATEAVPLRPDAHALLGRCYEHLGAEHPEGSKEREEGFRAALKAYNNAVRLWQGGPYARETRQLYRPALLDAAFMAVLNSNGDKELMTLAWDHCTTYLNLKEPLPPSGPMANLMARRLTVLADAFRQLGENRMADSLTRAAQVLALEDRW
jgi:tetratricopeptide (TPR) repeat protein